MSVRSREHNDYSYAVGNENGNARLAEGSAREGHYQAEPVHRKLKNGSPEREQIEPATKKQECGVGSQYADRSDASVPDSAQLRSNPSNRGEQNGE